MAGASLRPVLAGRFLETAENAEITEENKPYFLRGLCALSGSLSWPAWLGGWQSKTPRAWRRRGVAGRKADQA